MDSPSGSSVVALLVGEIASEPSVDSAFVQRLSAPLGLSLRESSGLASLKSEVEKRYRSDARVCDLFARIGYLIWKGGDDPQAALHWYSEDLNRGRLGRWQFNQYLRLRIACQGLEDLGAEVDRYYAENRGARDSYATLGLAWKERGRLRRALSLFRLDRESGRLSESMRLRYAENLYRANEVSAAQREVEEAYAIDGELRDAYLSLVCRCCPRRRSRMRAARWEFERERLVNADALRWVVDRHLRRCDTASLLTTEYGRAAFREVVRQAPRAWALFVAKRRRRVLELMGSLAAFGSSLEGFAQELAEAVFRRGDFELAERVCSASGCEALAKAREWLALLTGKAPAPKGGALWFGFFELGSAPEGPRSILAKRLQDAEAKEGHRVLPRWSPGPVLGPAFFSYFGGVRRAGWKDILVLLRYPWLWPLLKADNVASGAPIRSSLAGVAIGTRYLKLTIRHYRPTAIVFWGNWQAMHLALSRFARICRVPVRWMDNCPLPGRLLFEAGGFYAFSRFASSKCGNTIRTSSDRIVEPIILGARDKRRPIILCAGVHEAAIRLAPAGSKASKALSTGFRSNSEFLRALGDIAGHMGVDVWYRPHPNWSRDSVSKMNLNRYQNCIRFMDASESMDSALRHCVGAASLGSTVLDGFLAAGRPCILGARNHLWGFGCCHEVASKSALEDAIRALISGDWGPNGQQGWKAAQSALKKRQSVAAIRSSPSKNDRDLAWLFDVLERAKRRSSTHCS